MSRWKLGKPEPTKMSRFNRVKVHTLYGDGCWDDELLPTRYGMSASEKRRAKSRADEITAKYHPDTYKVKWARRLDSIHKRWAEVVVVSEKTGGIPVYL